MESLSDEEMNKIVDDIFSKEDNEILGDNNRLVVRHNFNSDKNIIVKFWTRQGIYSDIKFLIRYLFKITEVQKEWSSLNALYKKTIRVPKPLGLIKTQNKNPRYRYAIFTEDIGVHKHALDYIKCLIAHKREKELISFENEIIEMTSQIISMGYIDTDYSLINMLVSENGSLIKTDLEYLKRKKTPLFKRHYNSEMLYLLVISYVFAIQPDIDRVKKFYHNLCLKIQFSKKTQQIAQAKIDKRLIEQYKTIGLKTEVKWD